jgi:hypothetical protein
MSCSYSYGKYLTFPILIVFFTGICGCSSKSKTDSNSAKTTASSTNESIVTAPVDYISEVIRTGEQTKGQIEVIALQKAIEAYQQEEGRFPSSLEELAEKSYVKEMPHAPVGKKFQYHAEKGTVTLIPQ